MKISRTLLILALMSPLACLAQRKEFVELQRDIALLQDQVRTLQRSIDEKLAALNVLVQQTLDSTNKANTAVAVLDSGVKDRMRDQEKSLVSPVASLGSKVDQMTDEFRFVRESISDLTSRMNKLQTQISDLDNAIRTMQAPPPPPTAEGGSGPPAGVSAASLMANAKRDKLGGRPELALAQFQDFVRWFPSSAEAAEAEYLMGEILYDRKQFDEALSAFDMVLEKYPESSGFHPDARYMKGKTLLQLKQRTAAASEFRALLKKNPSGNWAAKAKAELKALGYSTTAPSTRKR